MLNLIKRDLILQKKQLIFYLGCIIFFIVTNSHPILTFTIASILIPFSTHAYDAKTETNILLNSLPYTRKEIVASRYIGAIVYMLLAIAVTSAMLIIFQKSFIVEHIVMGNALFLLFAAFTFPLFYQFKQEHLILFIIASFLGLTALVKFLATEFSTVIDAIFSFSIPVLYSIATAIIVCVYIVSWGVSLIIYQRKVF
ncbi:MULTISPECIES: ABC-2 transporter permease [Bacillus]|uniref:ABC-2 transporter permease n=1 Tax=Bacillus TaxID=1386 RepID=UPI00036023BE|nr:MULTISPECIES: ABC-2 transporter permease [Bacillus]PEP52261.1 ABC-2 transporter permease [Bacillus pseudomycoides]PHC96052.1 ABC-2 transporter permease [Bacillus pseudomycoides]